LPARPHRRIGQLRAIAFQRLVDPNHEENVQIFNSSYEGQAFTADGRRIVFVTYDDVKDVEGLASMDLAGGDRRDVKTPASTSAARLLGVGCTKTPTIPETHRPERGSARPRPASHHERGRE
jgi:hypothetical protein